MVYNKEYLHYNSAYWTYLLTRIQSLITNGGHSFEDKRTYLCCIIRSTYRGVGDDTAHPTRLHPRSDHCPDAWCHVGRMFSGETDKTLSLIIFIILVAIGLPVLTGGRGGIAVLVGPSAGYIFSFPIAAGLIGWYSEKIWPKVRTWKLVAINIIFGVLLVSLIGAPVMALITNTSIWAGLVGALAFLPGDIIKSVIAAVITMQLKAISPIEEKTQI